MLIEEIIQILKGLLTGKTDLGIVVSNPSVLLVVFGLALLGFTPILLRQGAPMAALASFALAALLGVSFGVVTNGKGVQLPDEQQQGDKRVPAPIPPPKPAQGPVAVRPSAFDIHEGHTLIGGDLRSAADLRQQRISLQACQSRCADDAACLAFSFDKAENSCVLKGAVTERKPFAAAVSGIRRGTDSAGGKR